MQFFQLYKKTSLFYLRNWIGTLCEIILPIFICIIVIALKRQIDEIEYPSMNYPSIKMPTSIQEMKDSRVSLKDCKLDGNNKQGGIIALSPKNDFTEQLGNYFESKNEHIKYFDNEQDLKTYINQDKYVELDENNKPRQICYAITFPQFDEINHQYEYNLRFNISNPERVDHVDARQSLKIPLIPNDVKQTKLLFENGTNALQHLIESMLIKKSLQNVVFDIKIQQMSHKKYKSAPDITQLPLALLLAMMSLIMYYRIIAMVVYERENRIIENMENMGMKKINYIMSAMCFNFTFYLIFSLIMAPLIYRSFLPNISLFLIFIIFWIFCFWIISLSYFISCFFVSIRKSGIIVVVIFFILFMFSIFMDQFNQRGVGITTFLALSPHGAITITSKNLLEAQSVFYPFGFTDLSSWENNFQISTYFIIGILSILFYILLSIYCFYVVPLEIGSADHPLFFLGINWKEEEQDLKKSNSVQNINNGSDRSLIFEEVEEELLNQQGEKQNLSIQNLLKKFPSGKVAVNNLNIEIYSNQIFSLLGHNGAGKTTTISMISGLLTKTKGKITVLGYDSHVDRDQIKKILGVCPQQNPVFDFLTVEEHLQIYAKLKGVEQNVDQEIDQVLKDIDLYHKKKYRAKNLSGGQKRKLCVAMAFIGNSKVILLDEPTSGMDTYARRLLWEMIKKYKQDRIIILTTHNMDEADYLGDRIGIMSDGKMKVCGSSLFLKNKFGTGYELTIIRNPQMTDQQVESLQQSILKISPNSKTISNVGSEIKINLPTQDQQYYKDVFYFIENNQEQLCIQNYGISLTTLEEVFLKVAEIKDEDDQKLDIQQQNNQDIIEVTNINDKDLEYLRENSQTKIMKNQIHALLLKQYRYFSRDWISFFCQIFLPLILIIIAFGLTKIPFVEQVPTINFSPTVYEDYIYLNQNNDITQKAVSHFPESLQNINYANVNTNDEFQKYLFEQSSNYDQNYALYLSEFTQQKLSYVSHYNSTGPVGSYIAPNLMSNSILKEFFNQKSYIKGNLKPLDLSKGEQSIGDTFQGFVLIMLLSLAFCFIPSSMIVFIIRERENNSKHQQFISGMGIGAYWLSNFIVDYSKYLFVALLTFILIWIFGVNILTDDGRWLMLLCLLLIYGLSFLPMIYFISFFFKQTTKAQLVVIAVNFLTGLILVVVAFVLRLLANTREIQLNVLDYIFRLIPFFSFNYAIINLSNLKLFQVVYKWDEIPSAFSPDAVLWDFLFLIIMGIVFLILLILAEVYYSQGTVFKTMNIQKIENQIDDENNQNKQDDDVLQEENDVKNMNHEKFPILIKDVIKVYPINKFNQKVAVKKVSFGVETGSVFCLLGTNGAGKTSIFKMLTGDVFPSKGEIFIKGNEMPKNMLNIRHLIGYCPQFDSLFDNLTGLEHLELYASLKGIKKSYQKQLINDLIKSMNLTKYQNVRAETYSGGNKRKLSVAIALLGRPPIVFLDEPSSGMDPQARRFMWKVIGDISKIKKNSSVILTTHSMEEAEALSSKLAIMVEGRIKTIGNIQELKSKYGNCFEVEIKLKILEKQLKEDLKIKLQNDFDIQDEIKKDVLKQMISQIDQGQYKKEFDEKGKAKGILKTLQDYGSVKLDTIVEQIIIWRQINEIEQFAKDKFNAELLESYQRYCKFKIGNENKLSELFGTFEGVKDQYQIENYSIKQISLEQIFISFAQNIEHDDQQIQIINFLFQTFLIYEIFRFYSTLLVFVIKKISYDN